VRGVQGELGRREERWLLRLLEGGAGGGGVPAPVPSIRGVRLLLKNVGTAPEAHQHR